MCKNMRINTDGNQAYREDLYKRVAEKMGESTKTGGIDAACIHAEQDLKAKTDAMNFLADKLSAAELVEVAELLSTGQVDVSADLEMCVEPTE
jgi:hypothetical protein